MLVKLINWTREPAKTVASRVLNYRGNMVMSLDEIADIDARRMTRDVMNTNLQGPLEAIMLNFNVFDVPRWMTHETVRNRIGISYSETSLRFTIIDSDSDDWYHKPFTENWPADTHRDAMEDAAWHYDILIKSGFPVQDARGVLPLDTLTYIGVDCTYRTLITVAAARLCTQAHPLWKEMVSQMKEEVRNKLGDLFANYLVPICVHMTCCPFGSVLDRTCRMRNKYPLREIDYWER